MERAWQKDLSKSERIKRMILNPIRAGEPVTTQVDLLDRLEGSQYKVKGRRSETPQEKVAREIVQLAADVSESLLRFGAGAREVETALIAVTGAYGLKHVDMDINYQAANINYSPPGEIPYNLLRVTRYWSDNYLGLVRIYELVQDIIEHKVSVTEARDRIRFINRSPKPYARWFVNLALGLFYFCSVITLGGTLFSAAAAFVISSIVSIMIRQMNKVHLPELYSISISVTVISVLAGISSYIGVPMSPSLIIASGVLSLLPTMGLVSAVRDTITGYPVTASARSLTVFLTFTGIVAGISIGLVIIDLVNLNPIDVTQTFQGPNFVLHIFLTGFAAVCYAISKQTARRTLMPVAACAMCGYITFYLMTSINIGPRLAPAIAAVVIGILARIFSTSLEVPSIVIFLPAMINLLPGMSILRATYNLTTGVSSSAGGITDLASAIMVAVGLAAGVVLGDFLGQPLESKLKFGKPPKAQ
ncbi:MAG: threonine/serine exporter family protein [Micrococcaceae bacterium]